MTQIDHLRTIADERIELAEPKPSEGGEPVRWQQVVSKVLWALLFLIAATYLVNYFMHCRETTPPNEIQQTYEKAIKQYRHEGR